MISTSIPETATMYHVNGCRPHFDDSDAITDGLLRWVYWVCVSVVGTLMCMDASVWFSLVWYVLRCMLYCSALLYPGKGGESSIPPKEN